MTNTHLFSSIDLLDSISLIAMAVVEGVVNHSNSLVRSIEGILLVVDI
jgi:hypothetical protein